MKRTTLAATLALALTGVMAFAQSPDAPPPDGPPHAWRGGPPSPEREAQRIAHELKLTPDQTAKLEPIFATRDQQLKAIRDNGQLTQDAAREQTRAVEKTTQEQLATVLTPAQLEQLRHMRRGPGGPRGPHEGPGGPPPPPPPPPTE